MSMRALLRAELIKLALRKGTYVGYALVVFPVGLMAIGARHFEHQFRRQISEDFVVAGPVVTAPFIPYSILLPTFLVLVPMIVAMVGGTMIAGETSTGTLRALLARPVRRSAVLLAKFLTAAAYAITVTFFVGLLGWVIGWLVFGRGDLIMPQHGLAAIGEHEAVRRLALAYSFAAVGMIAVVSIALLVSTLTKAPWIALVIAVGIVIVSPMVAEIEYFESIRPYLLTTNLMVYMDLFEGPGPLDWATIGTKLGYLGAYIVVPLIAALVIFQRKDVLC